MADDHRVGDKRTARGFDTVVTPVRGEEGTQGGVVESTLHVVFRQLERAACEHSLGEAHGGGCARGNHLPDIPERHPGISALNVRAVASNRSLLTRKQGGEEVAVLLEARWDRHVEAVAGQVETVVARRHARP